MCKEMVNHEDSSSIENGQVDSYYYSLRTEKAYKEDSKDMGMAERIASDIIGLQRTFGKEI